MKDGLQRRDFLRGIAAGFLTSRVYGAVSAERPEVLTGDHFDLTIEAHQVNFTGRRVKATLVNGSLPAPTLKWREGDTVTIAVTNHLPDETSIHWHGLRVPASMDGVPGLSFAGIASPNEK